MNFAQNFRNYFFKLYQLTQQQTVAQLMMKPRNKSPAPQSKPLTHSVYHHNKLQVYVKFRPPTQSIKKPTTSSSEQLFPTSNNPIKYMNPNQLQIQNNLNEKIYQFDRVFHHSVSSQEIFSFVCKQMIENLLSQGGHGLVFVYGNTGTGKTHTMGLLESLKLRSKGIIPQTLAYLFEKQKQISKKNQYSMNLAIQFAQIYLDEIYDLFEYDSQKQRKLNIRQNQESKDPYIQNQLKINVKTLEQSFQLINIGLQNRRVAQQKINKRSSRGHGLITLNFNTTDLSNKSIGKICFVDLAGSERIKQSQSKGQNLQEAVKINTSLSALQTLLTNISQQSVRMYRGNKLTRLLQPYLQRGKIKLIVTSNYEHLQPIQFAKRCKGIKFMQKSLQSTFLRKSLSPFRKGSVLDEQQKAKITGKYKQRQKCFYKCLTSVIALLTKVTQTIQQMFSSLNVQSCFSISDVASFQQIQKQINQKINSLQAYEYELIDQQLQKNNKKMDTSQSTAFSNTQRINWQLLSLVPKPQANTINQQTFISKLHETGFDIISSIKNFAKLSEFKNNYKKQLFTSQLKRNLLQDKCKKTQDALSICLQAIFPSNTHSNSISPTTISLTEKNKISKTISKMGIDLQKHLKDTHKKQMDLASTSRQKLDRSGPLTKTKQTPIKSNTKTTKMPKQPARIAKNQQPSQFHTPRKFKASENEILSRRSMDMDEFTQMQKQLNTLNEYLQKQQQKKNDFESKSTNSHKLQQSGIRKKNNQFIYIVERE